MSRSVMKLYGVGLDYTIRKSLFRREAFTALSDVSFDVRQGETLGLVGANGSGKSTLLKVMARIYGPDSGSVEWLCQNVSLLSLSVGFDNQLSGRDNALISGMFLGASRREMQARLDEIIEFAELGPFIDHKIKTYSAGMRARLSFAVAVKMQSDVLLIDEVLGVGDRQFRQKALNAMADKINSDQTVVLVSHSGSQIRELCDRVLWLRDGRVEALGDTEEVMDEYLRFSAQASPQG